MVAGVEGAAKPLQFGLLLPKSAVTSIFGAASWLCCLWETTPPAACARSSTRLVVWRYHRGDILKDRAGFCLYMLWPDHSVPGHAWAVFHHSLGCEERHPHRKATHRNSGKSQHSGLGGETASAFLSLGAFLRVSKPQLTFPFRTPSGPMTLSKMCLATCESTAERGSSSRKMSALLYTARARLTRCRCPPDRLMPWEETAQNKTPVSHQSSDFSQSSPSPELEY